VNTTPPPPGWYANPGDPRYQRYWDGHAWTVVTRTAPANGKSESTQAHKKSSASKQSWIKSVAVWFNTGTAAVKFAKALLGLLAFLGIITIGGAIVGPNGPACSSSSNGCSPTPVNPVRPLSAALLQPCDFGACGDIGWSQTQVPSASSTSASCPSLPQNSGYVFTALVDAPTNMKVFETIWRLANPNQAISTFTATAQNCSITNSSGDLLTYQADDADGSYGDESAIFTVGVTPPGSQNETSIGAYSALIARGNLLAWVYVTTGIDGTISQSTLNQMFTTAANKLL
jgi:Protein of unknown function (DUF2510)